MKSATRILTLVGLGLMTSATLGAVPAVASTSAPDAAASATTITAAEQPRRDLVVRYYDSRRECEWNGRIGERRNWWRHYDCDFVRRGPYRGDWRLTAVRRDHRDDDRRDGDDHRDGDDRRN